MINSTFPWKESAPVRADQLYGFRLPTFEEGLFFGLEHSQVQLTRELLFLCQPSSG
jgi:hypothetical protein